MMIEERRTAREAQLTIARRVLAGESLRAVAADYGVWKKRIGAIVHRVCQHLNPDVYCEEQKALLKRATFCWDTKPSLRWLREHAADFQEGRR